MAYPPMSVHLAPLASRHRATSFTSSHVAGRVTSTISVARHDGLHGPPQPVLFHRLVRRVDEHAFGRTRAVAHERVERLAARLAGGSTRRRPRPAADDADEGLASDRIADHRANA